ncbi:MAG: hypothetical protein ACRDTC_04550 [Pseudonocardiaceae bacterium]
MLRFTGPSRSRLPARHRLGAPGLVHCRVYPEVDRALAKCERGWLAALFVPVRRHWTATHRPAVRLRRVRRVPSLG